jgi:hypothetical protein
MANALRSDAMVTGVGFVGFFVWAATEENQLGSETEQGKYWVNLGFVGSLRLTLGVEMPS